MILKRPFAFFIKHFRLIHFILAAVTMYLTYNTISIISFFNEYMKTTAMLIDKDVTIKLFPFIMFVFIFIALIVSTLILILMKWKKKPIIFYIVNIANNFYVWGIYVYSKQIIRQLETTFIDLRTFKLIHDLLIIGLIIQTISIIIMIIRSTGFNLKRFNFDNDFDLKIDESDNEEFEFDVNVDTDDFKRNLRRNIRNVKYVYKENKLSIILAGLTILSIVLAIIYANSGVYSKIYKHGDVFRTSYFNFGVIDSYMTSRDYRNIKISDQKLMVVKVKAQNMTKSKLKLETAKIALTNGKVAIYPNSNYQGKFIDIGTVYVNDVLSDNKFKEYLLVYELPDQFIDKKLYLKYFDNKDKNITISLTPNDLDSVESIIKNDYNLNEKIEFKGSMVGNTELTIVASDINDRFKESYKFCINTSNCYDSYEYVVPTVADNYDKTLLKISAIFNYDDENGTKKISSLGEFLTAFGRLQYKIDGKYKTMNILFKEVKPKKTISNNAYLEVYKEVKDAEEVTLVITIRNRIYNYKLK